MKKQLYTRLVMSALTMLTSISLYAYDVEVDGIYYNLVNKVKNAEVTYGDNAYSGNITIPKEIIVNGITYTVNSIGGAAFHSAKVGNVNLPSSIETIGGNCFWMSDLTSINMPASLKEIKWEAFYKCNKLETINIENIEGWCNVTFYHNLESSNPMKYAQKVLVNGKELTELDVPLTVTTINDWAFSSCKSLKSVKFNNVTSIGNSAFRCVLLDELVIPDKVKSIGEWAFGGCASKKIGSARKCVG